MANDHPLARLIDSVKAANDWSDTKLVQNARERGRHLSKSNISRYRSPLVSIKGEIIKALAAGLRVSPAQVATAAIESMDIALISHDSPTPEQAVRLDTQLSDADKRVILALIEQLRANRGVAQPQFQRSDPPALDPAAGSGGLLDAASKVITPDHWSQSPHPPAGMEDADAAERQVLEEALLGHYIDMYLRALEQQSRSTLVEQARQLLEDSEPDRVIPPEIADDLYTRYIAARHSTPYQGGSAKFHAATGLTPVQHEAATGRYLRERSEMILFDGRIRTAGAPASHIAEALHRVTPPTNRKGRSEQPPAPNDENQDQGDSE